MEDILVDKEQLVAMDLGSKPIAMSREDCDKLDRKERSMIYLCLSNLILLNVCGEGSTKKLWDKLGNLRELKSMVNKLFLQTKLYHLMMEDGDFVTNHLNSFNTLVS